MLPIIVSILYVSLIIELMGLHVPSVANTQVLLLPRDELKTQQYPKYHFVFAWPLWKKIILLVIPHLLNVTAIIAPLILVWTCHVDISWMTMVGIMVAVVGRLITIISAKKIRIMNSQKNNDFTLHTDGPFKYSRNPILLGMYVFYGGLSLACNHVLIYIAFVFYMLYSNFRVKIEEDYLQKKFSEYAPYKERTRRYI